MLASLALGAAAWLTGCHAQTAASSSGSQPDLYIGPTNFAGYDNYAYRDNVTTAQVIVASNASSAPARFICAFPEGNTGVLTYFLPQGNGSTLGVSLDKASLASVSAADNQTGLQGNLQLSSDAQMGVTIVGSVRTIRDYTEGSGLMHEIFNYTLGEYNSSSVQFLRNWINGTTVQYLTLAAVDNVNFTVTPNANKTIQPAISLARPDASRNATVSFYTTFNYTDKPALAPGLTPSSIFLPQPPANASQGLTKVLAALTKGSSSGSSGNSSSSSYIEQAQVVSFLGYENTFLAGGWRFLTYFGRDTLLTLRLLLPVMSSTSAEAILGSVLERLNTTGTVCHEETIGDYASFVNINNNQSDLGAQPSYSYIMLDSDFLLLPSLAHYLLSTPQGQNRSAEFLNTQATLQNGTYEQILLHNVDHVLNLSNPFATSGVCTDLMVIRDTLVGNWRDSGTGLGYGKIPFDVATALAPGALRAISALSSAGVIPMNYSTVANQYATAFEANASECFAISISQDTATQRLESYVQAANLSESLLYGQGSLNGTNGTASMANGTSSSNITLYALSLDANGTAVEVQNSDLGFTLLYNNNVSESVLQAVVQALQPYPKGLLTNVGMVVANPAYDSNTTNIETFDYTQYHGTVVWGWQELLMAQGLVKQLARCGLGNESQVDYPDSFAGDVTQPAWCSTSLPQDLMNAQTMLWNSIAGAASVLYTEVWTPIFDNSTDRFTIGDLGRVSPTGTEGDAFQLWSESALGTIDPRTGMAAASGLTV